MNRQQQPQPSYRSVMLSQHMDDGTIVNILKPSLGGWRGDMNCSPQGIVLNGRRVPSHEIASGWVDSSDYL